MEASAISEIRNQIQEAYQAGNYTQASELLDKALLSFPSAPILWVIKGILLQLTGDAELQLPIQHFEKAMKFTTGAHHPLLEMAEYQYAVLNQAEEGLRNFQKLEEETEALYLKSLEGQVKCLRELGRNSEAEELKAEIQSRFPNHEGGNLFD